MTRDADNDNSSGHSVQSSEPAQHAWQGLSHGNAALADQPSQDYVDNGNADEAEQDNDQASSKSASHAGEATGRDEASGKTVDSPPESSQQELTSPTSPIPNSDAIPVAALGISMPHRPVPAERSVEVRQPQSRRHASLNEAPADLGKRGSEHLFNRPPSAARVQPEPSPMEKAINTKPRVPVTSQPGFLAGLVVALMCGGAYYGYLVL